MQAHHSYGAANTAAQRNSCSDNTLEHTCSNQPERHRSLHSIQGTGGGLDSNPDGSFPTQISEFEVQGDLRHLISPQETAWRL